MSSDDQDLRQLDEERTRILKRGTELTAAYDAAKDGTVAKHQAVAGLARNNRRLLAVEEQIERLLKETYE